MRRLRYREGALDPFHVGNLELAALPFASGDAEFANRARRLAEFRAARRGATQSVAWARTLDLPFAEEEDWHVAIYVPHARNHGIAFMDPTMLIELSSHPDFAWSVRLQDNRTRRYYDRPRGVAQDDIGLPAIVRLADLPSMNTRRGAPRNNSASGRSGE